MTPHLIIIDLFCGAGGTTTGFAMARPGTAKVIAAVNHDPKAIESHWKNHPEVHHFEEDIRTLDLTELCQVASFQRHLYPSAKVVLWASLECTNFSKAKGGKPRDADSRTLADHLHRYVDALSPDYVMIENVVEFMSWGPLDDNGKPVSRKSGSDWMRWRNEMNQHGYRDDWQELNAADFGARTSRNRLFGIFARPHLPITWPEQTHCKNPSKGGMFTGLNKWEACRPCLDLHEHGRSIFGRKKPLSEKTLERIYAGLIKYVAGMEQREFISKYYSGKPEGKNISITGPAGTITTSDGQALVQSEFLMKYNSTDPRTGEHRNASVNDPAPVIGTQRQPNLVQAHMIHSNYSNNKGCAGVDDPCPTVTVKDRHAVVTSEWIDRQFTSGGRDNSVDAPAGSVMPVPKMNLVHTDQFIMDTQFGNTPQGVDQPLRTITANRKWHYLMNPQYMNSGGSVEHPAFTLIARMDKAPPHLVEAEGGHVAIECLDSDSPMTIRIKEFMALFCIVDIKMRMLKVVELKRIQGFPEDYQLMGNQSDQKKFIGNSVVPHVVKAWAEALSDKLEHQIKVA